MARRARDEKGRLLKKDGTVDKRAESSKENLKKSSLYQRVIKNKETYETDSETDDDNDVDEFEIVEIKKKVNNNTVKPIEVVETEIPLTPVNTPVAVETEAVETEIVKPVEVKKKQKRLKIIKEESDSSNDEEDEVEVVKKKRYNKKINMYEEKLKKQVEETEDLKKRILYNTHLNRVNHLSRSITMKF